MHNTIAKLQKSCKNQANHIDFYILDYHNKTVYTVGGWIMINIENEANNYLNVCSDLKGLSELTLKAYKIDLKQFCEYMRVKDCFNKTELNTYINSLHHKYKPKTAKRKIACIKAFYRYMEIEDIIEINPFHKITLKYKEPIILPKTIPIESIKYILKYSYKNIENSKSDYQYVVALRNTIIVELLFSTGMRVSEISNLKIKSLDLQSNTIYIYGKGSKERIMCIANYNISRLLCDYLDVRNSSNDYVFINKLGNRYSEQSIRNMINNYAKAAGVDLHITPHMFRHTFATALMDENVNIRYIQQLLGHSSITTTQIYTHISTNRIRHILEENHPRNKLLL